MDMVYATWLAFNPDIRTWRRAANLDLEVMGFDGRAPTEIDRRRLGVYEQSLR